MSWAENRVAEYQHGSPATWLERRMLEHANPVHYVLVWVALVGFVYGLWTHDWWWIVGSIAVAMAGHVYCWMWKKPNVRRESASQGSDTSTVTVL